jgi:hypothetical protein
MHKFTHKAVVAAATLILGVGGSAVLAGTAFAGGTHDCGCNSPSSPSGPTHHSGGGDSSAHSTGVRGNGGNGGSGGGANANCLVPIGASAGVVGQGGPVSQCNAGGGAGGAGGAGIS